MSTLSWRPPHWRRAYSTTAKAFGRGSPPPPRSFLDGISKNKYSPLLKHANYCRRRGKVGYCIVGTSGRMHIPADGCGRGNKSNGTFNSALSMIEPTPIISPVLLKQKRHDLPYPTCCFDTAREGLFGGELHPVGLGNYLVRSFWVYYFRIVAHPGPAKTHRTQHSSAAKTAHIR